MLLQMAFTYINNFLYKDVLIIAHYYCILNSVTGQIKAFNVLFIIYDNKTAHLHIYLPTYIHT